MTANQINKKIKEVGVAEVKGSEITLAYALDAKLPIEIEFKDGAKILIKRYDYHLSPIEVKDGVMIIPITITAKD